MSLAFPIELQTLFGGWYELVQSSVFWWEMGVLALAAAGALVVHRALSQARNTRSVIWH